MEDLIQRAADLAQDIADYWDEHPDLQPGWMDEAQKGADQAFNGLQRAEEIAKEVY